jgi:hypothetical protein
MMAQEEQGMSPIWIEDISIATPNAYLAITFFWIALSTQNIF